MDVGDEMILIKVALGTHEERERKPQVNGEGGDQQIQIKVKLGTCRRTLRPAGGRGEGRRTVPFLDGEPAGRLGSQDANLRPGLEPGPGPGPGPPALLPAGTEPLALVLRLTGV